jgi:hypothetical protein
MIVLPARTFIINLAFGGLVLDNYFEQPPFSPEEVGEKVIIVAFPDGVKGDSE